MNRRTPSPLLISLTLMLGTAALLWQPWVVRMEVGDVYIKPHVRLDPKRTYRVVVWDYGLPLPWSKATHREELLAAAREFTQLHPNVMVEMVIRPWGEDDTRIRDALAAGVPPDVLGMPAGLRLLDHNFQVPLQHYLSPEETKDLLPGAQRAATSQGRLWAFPRWLNPARWVLRADRWPRTQAFPDQTELGPLAMGFTQWTAVLADSRTKEGGTGLAANVLDPAFFTELMMAATGYPMLSDDGQLQWDEHAVANVATQLREWVERSLIPSDVERTARTRLAGFWDGKALALAPVNPWLLQHVLQRSGQLHSPGDPGELETASGQQTGRPLEATQNAITWTPPPLAEHRLNVPATTSGYAVFRQAQYKGHDHTLAAAMVAAYLSRRLGLWESHRLFTVPAYLSQISQWRQSSLLPKLEMDALELWASKAVTAPLDDSIIRLTSRIMLDTVIPRLTRVLQGQISPQQFAKDVANASLSAAAEVAVP